MKDNRGITLVELLATITLLSIIGIIVWSVFIQGIKNTNEGATKTKLTQEMNYVQTTLRKMHQTAYKYEIIDTSCSIQIKYYNSKESSKYKTLQFDNDQICYKIDNAKINDIKDIDTKYLEDIGINPADGSFEINNKEIFPKDIYYSISFDLTLKDKTNERNKISTRTNLSRLKEES